MFPGAHNTRWIQRRAPGHVNAWLESELPFKRSSLEGSKNAFTVTIHILMSIIKGNQRNIRKLKEKRNRIRFIIRYRRFLDF